MKKVLLLGIMTMVLITGREVMAESEVMSGDASGNIQRRQTQITAGHDDATDRKIVKRHGKIRRHVRDHRKHRRLHHRRHHNARVHILVG